MQFNELSSVRNILRKDFLIFFSHWVLYLVSWFPITIKKKTTKKKHTHKQFLGPCNVHPCTVDAPYFLRRCHLLHFFESPIYFNYVQQE